MQGKIHKQIKRVTSKASRPVDDYKVLEYDVSQGPTQYVRPGKDGKPELTLKAVQAGFRMGDAPSAVPTPMGDEVTEVIETKKPERKRRTPPPPQIVPNSRS